ncbi:MAG TPA: biotin transporter BioY [Candidatus Hydrogenedentes bacterium]|nr:biotin transporter BioY [Candidatus Hydrogenedentota bacterium]
MKHEFAYERGVAPFVETNGWTVACMETLAVAGAVALGALIKLPLPFTPVPLTLQTLQVLLAAFAVGPRRAMAGLLLYMAAGYAGAPIFALSFGATFGYIAGFVMAPWMVARFRNAAVGIAAGQAVIYLCGAAWLSLWLHVSAVHAIMIGVAPFLAGDLLKGAVAYKLVPHIRQS